MAAESIKNALLRKLAQADPDAYARLCDDLEPASLHRRWAEVERGGRQASWVHFPETATLSLVAVTSQGHSVQVAAIGPEGMVGLPPMPGRTAAAHSVIIQVPGLTYRLPFEAARQHVSACPALQDLVVAHTEQLVSQLTQAAVCNRFHTATQRLARWLIVATERGETDRLTLTHELLAQMVGAPRTAVTQAAAVLRQQGNIAVTRGTFVVRNKQRLRRAACDCVDAFLPPRQGARR